MKETKGDRAVITQPHHQHDKPGIRMTQHHYKTIEMKSISAVFPSLSKQKSQNIHSY